MTAGKMGASKGRGVCVQEREVQGLRVRPVQIAVHYHRSPPTAAASCSNSAPLPKHCSWSCLGGSSPPGALQYTLPGISQPAQLTCSKLDPCWWKASKKRATSLGAQATSAAEAPRRLILAALRLCRRLQASRPSSFCKQSCNGRHHKCKGLCDCSRTSKLRGQSGGWPRLPGAGADCTQ